jgi:hypothetical protein
VTVIHIQPIGERSLGRLAGLLPIPRDEGRCDLSGKSKRSYADEDAALLAAEAYAQRNSFDSTPYRCRCGMWHLFRGRARA